MKRILVNPFSSTASLSEKYEFWLRVGVLGCFVGHGAWGVITKASWLPFYDIFFIPHKLAWISMSLVGTVDILVGVITFFYPTRALLTYAAFWTLFTALLRPSAGMGMSEFWERAGNYGIPVAFLALYGWFSKGTGWLQRLKVPAMISQEKIVEQYWILRLVLAALLAGHGGLHFFGQNPVLMKQLSALGMDLPLFSVRAIGLFEIILGAWVLIRPSKPLLAFILLWKIFCESLFPLSGRWIDTWETVERMGDYVAPIMLWMIHRELKQAQKQAQRSIPQKVQLAA